MLSLRQIERHIDQRQFGHLAQRIVRNGRSADAAMLARLTQPTNVVAAALGLALQRVVELTYRPTAVADAVACRLLDLQHGDGLFGLRHLPSLAGSAVALRGLIDLADQHRQISLEPAAQMLAAIERGMSALCSALCEHGRHTTDDVDLAIAHWQLDRCGMFRNAMGVAAALNEPEAEHACNAARASAHRSRISAA